MSTSENLVVCLRSWNWVWSYWRSWNWAGNLLSLRRVVRDSSMTWKSSGRSSPPGLWALLLVFTRTVSSSLRNRVSSRPTRWVAAPWLTSPSTFVSVVVSTEVASLRYVDGKTLIGMGTRASKSRLPTGQSSQTLNSPKRKESSRLMS